jgi:hypothetical protein
MRCSKTNESMDSFKLFAACEAGNSAKPLYAANPLCRTFTRVFSQSCLYLHVQGCLVFFSIGAKSAASCEWLPANHPAGLSRAVAHGKIQVGSGHFIVVPGRHQLHRRIRSLTMSIVELNDVAHPS